MSSKEEETLLFHNPDATSRLVLWTNIIAWIVLGLGVFTFANQAYSIIANWESVRMSLPTSLFDKISAFAKLFSDSFVPVVYFLVLRGVSVGLNILRDLFYGNVDAEDFDEMVEMEAGEAS